MNRIVVIEDEQEIQLRSGDRLLMSTDGITDSRNPAGEEFGEDRLIDLVLRFRQNGAFTRFPLGAHIWPKQPTVSAWEVPLTRPPKV